MKLTSEQIIKATGSRKLFCLRYEFGSRNDLFSGAAAAKRDGWVPIELDAPSLVLKIAKPESKLPR